MFWLRRVLVGLLVGTAGAQMPGLRVGGILAAGDAVAPEATVGAALQVLAGKSESVFVGQVVAIVRLGGVVETRFRVDEAVVGSVGAEFVLREWAGLWPVGTERFYVGQRAMVFVPAVGEAGLRSTVDGADGVVPVLLGAVGEDPLLDVGRLAARVLRAKGEPLAAVETGAVSCAEVVGMLRGGVKAWHEPRRLPLPVRYRPMVAMERGVPFLPAGEATEVLRGR